MYGLYLLFGVDQVEGGHGLDTEGLGVLDGELLCVIGAVEVVSRERALAASHVSPDDEVRAAIVLPDDHVLDGLTRTRHVHGVGQVGPEGARILGLFLQHLVRLVANSSYLIK